MGGSSSEGRVELLFKGIWGTVCDDNWDIDDARVVCRLLGFPDAIAAYGNSYFGRGTGQIVLDEVSCSGNESALLSCKNSGWGNHDCRYNEEAGVRCAERIGKAKCKTFYSKCFVLLAHTPFILTVIAYLFLKPFFFSMYAHRFTSYYGLICLIISDF